ncbi:MAG: KpsF/GutQ family sugar-phosphate isomerase [bacterium]
MTSTLLEIAKNVIKVEARVLNDLANNLDHSFTTCCELLNKTKHPIILSGLGKSGLIAKKITATLTSIGIKSIYLHPNEALHGDIGIIENKSCCLLLSNSGKTQELLDLLIYLKHKNCTTIALTNNNNSPLAQKAQHHIEIKVKKEADPLNILPSCSTTATLAMGDAIAITLMSMKKITLADFQKNHPAGTLGHLLKPVKNNMHPLNTLCCLTSNSMSKEILDILTKIPLGAVCITDKNKKLLGIITDGDIRRMAKKKKEFENLQAKDIMTVNPLTTTENETLKEALEKMQNRTSEISILPVISKKNTLCGLLRLHDIIGKINT